MQAHQLRTCAHTPAEQRTHIQSDAHLSPGPRTHTQCAVQAA